MNYEELLADIASKNYRESRTPETPYAALRAVVELHKPRINGFPGYPEYTATICSVCGILKTWPCVTVQAIAKELA